MSGARRKESGNNTGPENIKSRYPGGIVIYYSNPHLFHSPADTLQEIYPDSIICIINSLFPDNDSDQDFPADTGIQLGDTFYCDPNSYEFLLKIIYDQTMATTGIPFSQSLLPDFTKSRMMAQIGGRRIHVGGSNLVYVDTAVTDELKHFEDAALKARISPPFSETMLMLARKYDDLLKQHASDNNPKPSQRHILLDLYNFFVTGHADLVATAFDDPHYGIRTYVEAETLKQLQLSEYAQDEFIQKAAAVPTHIALSGGLNIHYRNNYALVSVAGRRNPAITGLEAAGFQIKELGPAHFADGGGVKCRLLHLNWRKPPPFSHPYLLL